LHLEHVLELLRHVVEALDAEREAHAPLRPELVDQQRVRGSLRVLEQERRAARLDRPIDDLRHLQVRIDPGGDPNELAFALEERDPIAKSPRGRHRESV